MAKAFYYDHATEFEMDRELGIFNPGAIVHLINEDDEPWGYTPDGEGFYWYDTIAELLLEH